MPEKLLSCTALRHAAALVVAATLASGCGEEMPPYEELPLRDALSAAPEVLASMPEESRREVARRLEEARAAEEEEATPIAADEEGAGVFNGDIGLLERVDQKAGVYQVRFDDRLANYDQNTLAELEHAWAITVHKSQGSEFEAVIIPLQSWHQRLYYRKLLYTAVTRAKKLLILVGRPETVLRMVESDRKTVRYSNLAAFLREEIGAGTED